MEGRKSWRGITSMRPPIHLGERRRPPTLFTSRSESQVRWAGKEKEATQALSVDWAQGLPDVPALGGLASGNPVPNSTQVSPITLKRWSFFYTCWV